MVHVDSSSLQAVAAADSLGLWVSGHLALDDSSNELTDIAAAMAP